MIYLLMDGKYRATVSEFYYTGQSIISKLKLFQKLDNTEENISFYKLSIHDKMKIKTILNSKSSHLSAYDTLCKGLMEYYKDKENKIGTIEVEND